MSKLHWGSLLIGVALGFVLRHYLKGRASLGA